MVVATLTAGVSLLAASPASPAPTWTAPVRLSPGPATGSAFYPDVALNAAGDAVAGWMWGSGAVSLTQVVSRAHGATDWSRPLNLAEGGSAPSLAVDPVGNALAAFTKGSLIGGVFQVAYRPGSDLTWQDPITVSPDPNTGGGSIAVNDAGDAVAGFTRWSGNGYVVQGAVRPASSGRWQQVVDLSEPGGNAPFGTAVAIDRAGTAVALWVRAGEVGDNPVVVSSLRPAGGTWTVPVDLGGPYGGVGSIHVAVDGAGNAVAVWEGYVRSSGGEVAFASYRPFGGSWSSAISLSSPSQLTIDDVQVAFDASGNALALWRALTPGRQAIVVADERPAADGKWQPSVQLSPSSVFATSAALAGDRAGNAVAIWTEGFSNATVEAALRPAASGTWEQPTQVTTGAVGFGIAAAIDEHGGSVAAWAREVGTSDVIESSDLKPGGPVLAGLRLPAHAAAGIRARFAVTPAPWGSPLAGEPLWDFGDDSAAGGKSVAHTYRRAGTYTVTVSQSDATGAGSRSTATVTVTRATLANRRIPSIGGVPRVGATLTCLPGTWKGSEPISLRYAWLRGPARVGTGARYRVGHGDAGSLLTCRVTATNGPRTRTATSRAVRVRG
jgi:PKD domain